MTTSNTIEVNGVEAAITRKDIKNLHISVYPPDGQVRVSSPRILGDEEIRLALVSKLGWIRRQQDRIRSQERETPRRMVDGEDHYVWGRAYRLRVIEHDEPPRVEVGGDRLNLFVRPGAGIEKRRTVLNEWYRSQLEKAVEELRPRWEKKVGVSAREWRTKRMKTRWGTTNREARRIWLNLELAKKPRQCLEYVIVHELVHMLERDHGKQFIARMDQAMPNWRSHRDELNRAPLAHDDWKY